MKAHHILIAVILCFMQPAWGQLSDDFSDGNLDGWGGDVTNFIVNGNNQLQLNAPSGSTLSWIHTPVVFQDSMTWELYFKLDFAPSTSNQLRIQLATNSTDLATADGYFLQIGSTGDTDAIELHFANNGAPAPIGQSVDGLVANEPEMTLRVVKHDNGNWEIYRIGTIPELLFTAFHNAIPLSQMNTFGFDTEYTETRRDKFYFDNISISELQLDVTGPTLLSLEVVDQNTVELTFDEQIEVASAIEATNYLLTPGNTNPANMFYNGNIITLDFVNDFANQQLYTLQISGLKDFAGNTIQPTNTEFTFVQVGSAGPNELIITELMADPTPLIGLPDAEYIELFNYSAKVLRLSDYSIKVGSGERNLPDELINPMEYIILANEEDVALFESFGRVVAIDLPALTNSGATVSVLDALDNVLQEISYTLDWYHNSEKSDGGWSLEMLNPENVCATDANWAASEDLSGGTPGQENSQWTIIPDVSGPGLISLIVTSPQTLELRFNEKVNLTLMSNPANYTIQPFNSVDAVSLVNPTTIELHLIVPLDEFTVFSIPSFFAYDCLGNEQATPGAIEFGIPKDAGPGDLLINEVLFNPATGGSRFLEIYNVTNRFIKLENLVVARLTPGDQDFYPVEVNEIIPPQSYAAFTPDRNDILGRYTVPNPNALYTSDLPSWDEDNDNVSILVNGEVIDSFTYSSSWHHPALADQNGVSLERATWAVGTTVASNWHSAASLSGGATPTGPNSQRLIPVTPGELPYSISTRNFSPNDDGFKDFFAMQFNAVSADDIASVWVYDREGREVIQLLSNELVGSQALVTWDGRTADNSISTMGIYILLVRVWNIAGDVKEYQESFALIDR